MKLKKVLYPVLASALISTSLPLAANEIDAASFQNITATTVPEQAFQTLTDNLNDNVLTFGKTGTHTVETVNPDGSISEVTISTQIAPDERMALSDWEHIGTNMEDLEVGVTYVTTITYPLVGGEFRLILNWDYDSETNLILNDVDTYSTPPRGYVTQNSDSIKDKTSGWYIKGEGNTQWTTLSAGLHYTVQLLCKIEIIPAGSDMGKINVHWFSKL